MADVIVIGAGITGLTAAHLLTTAGHRVTVFESTDAVGGRMSTRHCEGFAINRAANILPSTYAAISDLIAELGLADRVDVVPGVLALPRGGRLHRIRSAGVGMAVDAARTRLLSPAAKLRMGRLVGDALRMRRSLSYESLGQAARFDTMTAAEYSDRRLDDELYEYLVDPIVRALFTTEADRVSVVDFFFAAVNFVGAGFLRYRGGIGFLPDALAAGLDIRHRTLVDEVRETSAGVSVRYTAPDATGTMTAHAAVVATPATIAGRVCVDLPPRMREILTHEIEYGTTVVAHHALRRPADTGALVIPIPRAVHPDLCVVTDDQAISPTAAPAGRGLISTYWIDTWSQAHRNDPEDALEALVRAGLSAVLPETARDVDFTTIDRWCPSVVRSRPGFYRIVAELSAALAAPRRVQLAGDYLTASSTNGCVVSARGAVKRLLPLLP